MPLEAVDKTHEITGLVLRPWREVVTKFTQSTRFLPANAT